MSQKSDNDLEGNLTESMDSALAAAVAKFPILYDGAHRHRSAIQYPEQHERAWNKVSDELNLEVDSCQLLWSCMKQKFVKYRKKLDKGESVSVWPIYEELTKWLDQHVKKRRSRYDLMKGARQRGQKRAPSESANDDDAGDEEWTDLMEDRDTMVKIQVKRKDRTSEAPAVHVGTTSNKKKFKFEVVNEQDTEILPDMATSHTDDILLTDCDDKLHGSAAQIEVIEVKDSLQHECQKTNCSLQQLNASLETNLGKLEQILLKCIQAAERTMTENTRADSNDTFGKYVASLVRELPTERRVRAQCQILQYATELIGKEMRN